MSQPNVFNTLINPIMVQQFERYLPTAFDEGMTLLEKVNKIIISLNRMGKLSNDVLDQWNQVMDWVMSDGLDASIDAKLDSMVQDGTLDTIINHDIFNELNDTINTLSQTVTTLSSTVSQNKTDLEAEMETTKTDVASEMASTKTTIDLELADTNSKITKMKYYGTPEEYGAVGDGVSDDTIALQNCLNENLVTKLNPNSIYRVTTTIKLPKFHSIDGNGAKIRVNGGWVNNTIGGTIPATAILWIQPRDPIFHDDYNMLTKFVRDLRIEGDFANTYVGMYLGYIDRKLITQDTCVNYSVTGYQFNNISIINCQDGMVCSEVWGSNFVNVSMSGIAGVAFHIQGQCVNNTFTSCSFTSGQGYAGVVIEGNTYNSTDVYIRPEGNMFIGGFYGYSTYGIRVVNALATLFSGLIVDLNTVAVTIDTGDYVTFTDCWFSSYSGQVCITFGDRDTSTNLSNVSFKGCKFVSAPNYQTIFVGNNQNGIILDGCFIDDQVYFAANTGGVVKDCFFVRPESSNPMVSLGAGSTVVTTNNKWKNSGNDIIVQRA